MNSNPSTAGRSLRIYAKILLASGIAFLCVSAIMTAGLLVARSLHIWPFGN